MKTINLSLEQAKAFYKQGGAAKEFAMQVYTEEELTKQDQPRSWEEFCENYPIQDNECWINSDGYISIFKYSGMQSNNRGTDTDKNFISSEKEAEAFIALMQLRQLRKVWIGEWKPNWEDIKQTKWCIYPYNDVIRIEEGYYLHNTLSFPTEEMARDFLNCFHDFIEKIKPLYQ